jgi:hypothetical protein
VVNVLGRELAPLERSLSAEAGDAEQAARVRRLVAAEQPGNAAAEQETAAQLAAGMRAAAPPVQSFAAGRRR